MKRSWILIAASISCIVFYRSIAIEKPPQFIPLDRFVAIDGACAWPQLSIFPNGEIAALVWPYPNHGYNEGAAECWTSADRGASWRKSGVPAQNEPGVARLNLAAGVTETGTYLTLVGGFGGKPPPSAAGTYKAPKVLPNPSAPILGISSDQGRTWRTNHSLIFQQANQRNLVPYGRISVIAKGELGVMCYLDELIFYSSRDDGLSWQKRGQVSKEKTYNETTWIRLENGELFAAARTWEGRFVEGLRSSDSGVTWRSEGALTLPDQHPADLIHLPDGRVLMTYGVRNQGLWGICVRIGNREAREWSSPALLVDMEDASDLPDGVLKRDGGYPSTVVLPDGVLLTAYYSRGIPAHRRYHMAVIRWKLMN